MSLGQYIRLREVALAVKAVDEMESVRGIIRVDITPPGGPVVVRPPRVTRNLVEPASWLTELGAIYRAARRGELPTTQATRLAYIAGVAAKLSRELAELKQAAALQQQLERLGVGPTPYHMGTTPVTAESEVLPP
jgi:hypothetical protein